MQKLIIILLSATSIALGVWCAALTRQLRVSDERATAALEAQSAEADARQADATRLKELERSNAQLDQQIQKFTAVTTMLRTNEAQQASNLAALTERIRSLNNPPEGGPDTAADKGPLFGKGMGKMLGDMMKDPAMREMMRDQQKAAITMMYSGLFKELNLSPEEKEKFQNLLTDAQMRNMEGAQGLFSEKKEGAGTDPATSFAEAKKQTDAEIKALLGDERFGQYEDYQKNIGERMQLDQLRAKMAGENMPLQDEQMAQLFQVMKDEKTAVPPVIPTDQTQMPKKEMFTAENLDRQIKWMEDYNRRVLDRAGQILTPEQLKQYRDFQEQQTAMQKFGLNMARQMFDTEKLDPPPPASEAR